MVGFPKPSHIILKCTVLQQLQCSYIFDNIFHHKENWEMIEKKILQIAKDEKDNINVQNILMLAGSETSEGK